MLKRISLTLGVLLLFALSFSSDSIIRQTVAINESIPAPKDVLGFTPGDDRKLASWAKIVEYFQKLDAASDRVKFEEIGKTTMGAPFVYATISAPENLERLDEFKDIQRQLADPRLLRAGNAGVPARKQRASGTKRAGGGARAPSNTPSDQKARALIARGKTIVLITCGIHSTEVGSTLSSTLIAHRLASSNEPEVQEILRNTIILLVPSTNPDGVDIVKNWYDKTLNTSYEGTEPPELYHKYVGHDNNRDWYAFTQVETQLTVDKLHNVWHPQIVHDIHQQGAFGSRLFLPPYMQPVEPNVPKKIIEGYTELGNYMAKEMRAAGFKGITTNSTYDAWTPARAYSHYHGGVRILSETASARLASPRTVKFEELRARGEGPEGAGSTGYDPKKESANFGPVWRGGEWKLRDITNTMTSAAFILMKHAAQNRELWLTRFYEIGKEAVRPRKSGELVGFKIDRAKLADILQRGGVRVQPLPVRTRTSRGRFVEMPGTDYFISLAQPYGAFAKALLETQSYPNLRSASGTPIPPYDVTAHTLPLLLGTRAEAVYRPIRTMGDIKVELIAGAETNPPVTQFNPRTGLYMSHAPSMDEGWTRWVLEQEQRSYRTLRDIDIRANNLRLNYDTIIIPDQARAAILNGHRKGAMPDEYTGGVGEEGVKALREFVEEGGTLVCLNRASEFAIEQFKLPVRNVVAGLPRTDFYVPGSILRIELDTTHPIAKAMPKESIAWFENSPVFEVTGSADAPVRNEREARTREAGEGARAPSRTAVPHARVIAWYPRLKDPLLSGWLLGTDRLRGKAALVEVTLGKGRIILFGFRPQYRGQSLATYPLLFNSITRR
jgi:hypothetical protein